MSDRSKKPLIISIVVVVIIIAIIAFILNSYWNPGFGKFPKPLFGLCPPGRKYTTVADKSWCI